MEKPKAMESFDMIEVGEYSVYLNGNKASEELQKYGFEIPLSSLLDSSSQCPYCKDNFLIDGNTDLSDSYYTEGGKDHLLWYCRNCRFWQWYYVFDEFVDETRDWRGEGCPPSAEQKAYISKLREFNDVLPADCNSEFARYLRRNLDAIHRYDPRRFEELVADIFKANYKNAEVIHVGKPDDGGVDVILIASEDEQWLVQVKRRERQNCSEGISTIRNLLGAMVLEGKMHGILVSTADHFTLRAQQATKRLRTKGFHIKLIDKGILNRMLDPILPDRPWFEIVKSKDPKIAKWLLKNVPSDNQLNLFDF